MISTTIYTKNYKQGWLGKLGQTHVCLPLEYVKSSVGILCAYSTKDVCNVQKPQHYPNTLLILIYGQVFLYYIVTHPHRQDDVYPTTLYIYIFMICFYWVNDFTCRSSLYTHCVALTCLRLLAWFVFIVLNTIVERILKGDGYL